jgi:lipoprotein-releasing system ATP-binding protein
MLTASNLSKRYGQLTVLKSVSLHIKKGEFITIVGPSGAGKSTLLHLLGGLDLPDEGEVTIMGQSLFNLPNKKQFAFRNKHMGFVFQFHHLLPEFSALENTSMPLWIGGVSRTEAQQVATKILADVGLKERLHHKPAALSGGEQQRVAIARAIATQPAIVFADEPTGNLDTANAALVHELFLELQDRYKLTFVIVTHNEHLAELADRTFYMQDGKIVKEEVRKGSA